MRDEAKHLFLQAKRRPVPARLGELGGDGLLREQDAGARLEVADLVITDQEGREALADGRRVEQLVGDAEAAGDRHRSREEAAAAVEADASAASDETMSPPIGR
jgi:hypothetical protein